MIKFLASLFLLFISLFFARLPIATWVLQRYAKSLNQDFQFEITSLSLTEFTLKNIRLNSKNIIPLFTVQYQFGTDDFLKKIQLDIDTLDAESLRDTFAQIASNESETSKSIAFDESLAFCRKFRKIDLLIQWREVVVGTKKIPLQLRAKNEPKQFQIVWDDQKNSKGFVAASCEADSLQVTSPRIYFELKDIVKQNGGKLNIKQVEEQAGKKLLEKYK